MQSIQFQINHLADSGNKHQRLIESKERANRINNLVFIGLEEERDENTTETMVKDLLRSKMNLDNICLVKAHRIGKRRTVSQTKNRPILVTFQSKSDKGAVLLKQTSLAGTKIYINNDLTREQLQTEKQLRDRKKKMIKHPEFKNKLYTVTKSVQTTLLPLNAY